MIANSLTQDKIWSMCLMSKQFLVRILHVFGNMSL